ncbi:MAG: hypothetical protein M3Z09_14275 [Acidobacteriota bacterium]|nr:hypothetical protein [Acidobacteriota bacterium]
MKTLGLLAGSPVNCVLLEWSAEQPAALAGFAGAAVAKSIVPVAVLRPGGDTIAAAKAALAAKMQGIVLEGEFPEGAAVGVRSVAAGTPVIELTLRSRMKLGTDAPVIGTYQGVWAGIQVTDNGASKAGPSGSAWIDTNSGFLRAVRAWGGGAVWLANLPPKGTVIPAERYLQMIGDAEMVGARWVVALDDDFAGRLYRGDAKSVEQWKRITQLLGYFEEHKEWRSLRPGGKLAIVQETSEGGLLSGGILDMIAVKHTPVQAVPPQRLSPETLKGTSMAVNIDNEALDPHQKEILKQFTRSGGTVLTGPPGWRNSAPVDKTKITLDEKELKRIDDMWHDMQAMIGRKNLGVRLFNVSSMLSNLLASPDGKQVYVELVNYADYPVENVTMHVLGDFRKATLYTPDGRTKALEVYKNDEGTGVDIDSVAVVAAVRLE